MTSTPMDKQPELTEEELFEETDVSEVAVENTNNEDGGELIADAAAESVEAAEGEIDESPTEQLSLDSEQDDEEEPAEEFVEEEFIQSIIESVLFATDRPVSIRTLVEVFRGTNVKRDRIKRSLENLSVELAGGTRGVYLEQISGGYQLRTKVDNMKFLKRAVKARPFKLSGPALEVLSVIAYKQPVVKSEIDEIRGVDSGHLVRSLMDRGLISFAGKSELPGRPMQYATARKFLEIFGLRNINELPSLSEIDEILPEGITEEEDEETLNQLTSKLSEGLLESYSEGEEELEKITSKLSEISTSAEFFEQEKIRQREERDRNRANDIEEALAVGETVEEKDLKWLTKYQAKLAEKAQEAEAAEASEVEKEAQSEVGEEAHAETRAEASVETGVEETVKEFGVEVGEDSEPQMAVLEADAQNAITEDLAVEEKGESGESPVLANADEAGDFAEAFELLTQEEGLEDSSFEEQGAEDIQTSSFEPVDEVVDEHTEVIEPLSADDFAEAEVAQAILDFEKDDDDGGLDN